MDLNSQIELEIYFADHFDTILFPVLADMYLDKNDFRRARKVCDIGLKHNQNDSVGLFILAKIEQSEGNMITVTSIRIIKTYQSFGVLILHESYHQHKSE